MGYKIDTVKLLILKFNVVLSSSIIFFFFSFSSFLFGLLLLFSSSLTLFNNNLYLLIICSLLDESDKLIKVQFAPSIKGSQILDT